MNIQKKVLLTPSEVRPSFSDWSVQGVLNPAAVRMPNKKILLMARIAESSVQRPGEQLTCPIIVSDSEEYEMAYQKIKKERVLKSGVNIIHLREGLCRLTTISHLRRIIVSPDGFTVEKVDDGPTFMGVPGDGDYGVEDARIVKIGSQYVMTYVSVSLHEGVCGSLAVSKNLVDWERKGIIFRQQNKDVVIFPEKIRGKYVALHRPEGTMNFSKRSIWISHSPDLIYWGKEKSLIRPRDNSWDDAWTGAGPPPIKTKKGWLLIYHGVKTIDEQNIYSVGSVLLDLKNPEIVLARTPTKAPLLEPKEKYEASGFVNQVVFPTGAVPTLDGKDILLYSGGGDKISSVKKVPIKEIFARMEYF